MVIGGIAQSIKLIISRISNELVYVLNIVLDTKSTLQKILIIQNSMIYL